MNKNKNCALKVNYLVGKYNSEKTHQVTIIYGNPNWNIEFNLFEIDFKVQGFL